MRCAVLSLLALSACHPRWVLVDVHSAGAPVVDATVSAVCQPLGSAADRSDPGGAVALAIPELRASVCTVTASREGLRTARREGVVTCRDRARCTPVEFELEAR